MYIDILEEIKDMIYSHLVFHGEKYVVALGLVAAMIFSFILLH